MKMSPDEHCRCILDQFTQQAIPFLRMRDNAPGQIVDAADAKAVTMSIRTSDATSKTSVNDYIAKSDTLTFAPGETTKSITIEVKGDTTKSPMRRSTSTCSATAAIRCSPRIAASARS